MIKLISEKTVDGKKLKSYALENKNGMRAEIINYGARLHKLFVKNKEGKFVDILAGFDDMAGFLGDNPYFNATIGRVGTRIGKGHFVLNGKEYQLYNNDGVNHLHGGKEGFDRKIWDSEIITENDQEKLMFSRVSEDGEENYPANLAVTVKFSLTDDDALNIEYYAKADGDTLCNLTNHAYFNLSGDFNKTVRPQYVKINADGITLIDSGLIPDGRILKVKGTPFDFNEFKQIGKDIDADDETLKICGGYDVNYVLKGKGRRTVAEAYSEESGIKMEVITDLPCMQLYTGNFLDGLKGKTTYYKNAAFCMETQGYPNACNVPSFESIVLKKNKEYVTATTYKFTVKE